VLILQQAHLHPGRPARRREPQVQARPLHQLEQAVRQALQTAFQVKAPQPILELV